MSRIATAALRALPRTRVAPRAAPAAAAVSSLASTSRTSRSSSSLSSSSRVRLPRATPLHARTQMRAFHASNPSLGVFPFKLHDIGEGITEVEMIKWHVKVGDVIEEFDSLCEVQSDKSVVEITSPHAGKILKLNAETGKVVKVGMTLCEIETDAVDGAEEEAAESEPEPAAPPPPPPPPAREPAPAPVAAAPPPPPPPAAAPAKPAPRAPRPHPLSDTAVRFEGEASVLPQAPPRSTGAIPDSVEARRPGGGASKRIVKASPATRALASRLGIELEDVSPTGDGGRVTKEDVERAAAGPSSSAAPAAQAASPSRAAAPAPAPAAPRASAAPVDRGDASERMEMGRTRKVMYKAMGSMGSVPHFGYSHTLDLTNLLPLMRAANAPETGPSGYIASDVPPSMVHAAPVPHREKTSLLAFLVKALALALEEHPIMRARVKEANDERERYLEVSRDANIGIAVSDPQFGLLTPSLPALDPSASVATVAAELAALRKRAARPGPPPHITLSSVGGLGEARGAMPVLPPGGGLAIAAVGRAAWEVEWALRGGDRGKPKDAFGLSGVWGLDAGQVEKAGTRAVLRCPVGWSGDHRVLEGAELIAFTETWKRFVEEPWRWVSV